ncbi:MAG: hypothetical protein JSR11_01030 [Bacteroidetes bacterium]|nr:hypothetical protein [Bacteroidota bacterium]
MKTLVSIDSVTILSAADGWATAVNNLGSEFKIRYSQKKNFIENMIGKVGELSGTKYDDFIQLSGFWELKTSDVLNGINASFFFPKFTTIKNYKHKLRNVDGNGKPIDFSADEKKQIKEGLRSMVQFIIASLK